MSLTPRVHLGRSFWVHLDGRGLSQEFRRLDVSVVTATGATLAAITYAWAMAEDRLDGPWSYERVREQLPQYMGLAAPAAGDAPTYAFFSSTPASS